MRYIDVQWHHEIVDAPTRLVSELDDAGWETRKLEFFRDGRVGFASRTAATLGTKLSIEPLPSIESINADDQFTAIEFGKDAFEMLWGGYATIQ